MQSRAKRMMKKLPTYVQNGKKENKDTQRKLHQFSTYIMGYKAEKIRNKLSKAIRDRFLRFLRLYCESIKLAKP